MTSLAFVHVSQHNLWRALISVFQGKSKGKQRLSGNFPGYPVVEMSPSNAEGASLILGWGAEVPLASQPKGKM